MEKPAVLKDIEVRLEDLRGAYLVQVGRAGRVILKGKLKDFEKELAQIEGDLQQCREAMKGDLADALATVAESLVPELSRAVLTSPPARFRGLYPMSSEAAATFVREELWRAFPSAEDLVDGMRIHKFYKDATYETLKNEEFEKKVKDLIPSSILNGALLHEHTAAESAASVTK